MDDVIRILPHEKHVENGEHINLRQLLDTEQLLVLDVVDFYLQLAIARDSLLGVLPHLLECGYEEPGGSERVVPAIGIHVDIGELSHEAGDVARRQHDVVPVAVRDGNPAVERREHAPREVDFAVRLENRQDSLLEPFVQRLDFRFAGILVRHPHAGMEKHGIELLN